MDGRRGHRSALTVAVLLAIAIVAPPVVAEEEKPEPFRMRTTTTVYTNSNAAVVEGQRQGDATPANSVKQRRRSCHVAPDTANVTSSNIHIYNAHTNERAFNLICDGQWLGLVWRPIDPSPKAAPSPRRIAEELREEIPMPDVTIRINPEIGLTGTESWFWVEGYSGDAVARSINTFGEMVEVAATVSRYEWDFGDGTVVVGSLGQAYPQRSDVSHLYEKATSASTYRVVVRFVFTVRYRVNGGPWYELPGISRTASIPYQVRQSQAVIER